MLTSQMLKVYSRLLKDKIDEISIKSLISKIQFMVASLYTLGILIFYIWLNIAKLLNLILTDIDTK